MASDAEIILKQFGEEITYRPANGNPRLILAVVDRNPPEGISQAPGGMGQNITITVANRQTDKDDDDYGGISGTELDTGGDKIDVALRLGEDVQTRIINGLVNHDDGMLRLEVS